MKKLYFCFLFIMLFNVAYSQLNLKLIVQNNNINVTLDGPYTGTFGTLNFEISVPSGVTLSLTSNPYAASIDPSGPNVYYFSYSDVTNPIPSLDFNITQTIATITAVGGVLPYNFMVIPNENLYAEIGSNAFFIGGASSGAQDFNATVLPIHLQSFTAQKFGPNSSLLEWTSASEDNASHYEVERSMDAQNWTYVSTEVARGSVNYKTDYSFVDSEAILQRDRINIVYYRLKLVDKDGKFDYSEVRSVSFDGKDIVSIEAYPNPTTESLNLRMSVGDTKIHDAQMQMLDMAGKLVKKQTISANGISTVELGSIEPGVYNVIVKHDNKVYQKRIIKTN